MNAPPRLGVVFPQTEIEPDASAVRDFVVAAEELGLAHLLLYDHVLSVDSRTRSDFVEIARRDGATAARPYDHRDPFHEVMVLMGYLAAVTRMDLCTGVLILPQRQTALVAKQATQVDILTGGRLRLGVGVGWNRIESMGLGADFDSRGARLEEQVAQLRRFWTEPSLNHLGVDGVGITPMPVQRPIPIWLAAGQGRALRRVGRLADGWLPVGVEPSALAAPLEAIRVAAAGAGRDPAAIGIEGRLAGAGSDNLDAVLARYLGWRELGATHLSVMTLGAGLHGAAAHIRALERTVHAIRAA